MMTIFLTTAATLPDPAGSEADSGFAEAFSQIDWLAAPRI